MSTLLSVVTVAVCAITGAAAAGEKHLRGVAPQDVAKYSAASFVCDGGVKLPKSMINDDYCDCKDGSDEPGTSACDGGKFYCANEMHVPKIIFSSMVNDGICDCCDGSDEYLTNACTNTCEEAGRAAREEAKRLAALQAKGYEIKLELIQQVKAKKEEMKARLAALEAKKPEDELKEKELRAAADAAKAALDALKHGADEEEQAAAPTASEPVQEQQQAAADDATAGQPDAADTFDDADVAADEEFFNDDMDLFEDDEAEVDAAEVDWKTRVRRAQEEAERVAKLQDHVYGTAKKAPEAEQPKAEDTAAEGDAQAQGEGTATTTHEETEEEKLEKAHREADQALRDFVQQTRTEQTEANDIRTKLAENFDYGPDEEFFLLNGDCFELDADNFRYKMCPFKRVDQNPGSINLGTSFAWTGKGDDAYAKYTEMQFTSGTPCWQGPARSTTVRVMCGLENKVDNVAEPQKCVYTMDFHTPTVCRKPAGDAAAGHDEL